MKKSIGTGRGSVYNILLKALQSGDKYGYEICKEIEEKTNGTYILKQASLYSGLKRLEAQGDITSYWKDSALGGRRHYYSLTQKGLERISSSNFSWTDARDDIVGSLFEKSQVEKDIESVTKDVENLKAIANDNIQKNIEEVLTQTNELVEKDDNQDVNKIEKDAEIEQNDSKTSNDTIVNTQSDDLFSIFSSGFNFNNKQTEEIVKENEKIDNTQSEKTENDIVENIESTDKNDVIEEKIENKKIEKDEIVKNNVFDVEDSQENKQLDLFSFVNTNQNSATNSDVKDKIENNDIQSIKEDETNTDNKMNDIFNNLKTVEVNENIKSTENPETKTALLQKNNENVFDNYLKSHISVNRFSDSVQYELPKKEYSNYGSDFGMFNLNSDEFEQKIENFEKNNNINTNNDENIKVNDLANDIADNVLKENETEKQSSFEEVKESEIQGDTTQQNENKSFDYRDIFGDIMSNKESENHIESNISQNAFSNSASNNEIEKENKQTENQSFGIELPHTSGDAELSRDINRTLSINSEEKSTSSSFESYDSYSSNEYSENPFEKYDSYTEPENVNNQNDSYLNNYYSQSIHTERTKNMSFDRKFANEYNRFDVPDYEVRYFKKRDVKNEVSRYISINKLNLVSTSILCLLVYVLTTLTVVIASLHTELSGFQTFLYVSSYAISISILLIDFVKYLLNKNKKCPTLNPNKRVYNFAVGIILVVLSITINIIAGFNFVNIDKFVGSIFLPIWYFVALVIEFPLKKFLAKFSNFYT